MAKPLTETLRMLQGGAFNVNAGELLAAMVKAVEETGKAGKLTITLDIKKAGGALQVTAKATDKTPEEAPESDLFWSTVEGNLTVQNPNQQSLNLQPVPTPERRIAGEG